MTFEELIKENDCYISFENISEPRTEDIRLRIIINKSDNPSDLLIFPHPDSNVVTLQIDFENYVTYSVMYDDYTTWDDSELFRGKSFRIYEKSNFFDFIQKKSCPPSGKLTHYSLACFEHKIDIISDDEPVITIINSENMKQFG